MKSRSVLFYSDYIQDRLRERRLRAFANGLLWTATLLALIGLIVSMQ